MKQLRTAIAIFLVASIAAAQKSEMVVKTPSMEPNIKTDDLLIVDEEYYSARPIGRFDVVVLKQSTPVFKAVARVIALGGETITIRKNKVFIDRKALKEPFKTIHCSEADDFIFPCGDFGPFTIPDNQFFLLADNRAESLDSRLWKPHSITRDQILGKVIKIVREGKTKANL